MPSLVDIRNPHCQECKLHKTADVICQIGYGPVDADIMVVSKMPNSRDWQEELEQQLEEMGLGSDRMYFASAIKCRTFDQDASNLDIKTCRQYLDKEIQSVKPKYILALGNEALFAVAGKSGINKYRGRVIEDSRGFDVIATISPAAVKRSPRHRPGFTADIRLFANRVMGVAGGIPEPNYTVIDTREKLDKLKEMLEHTIEFDYDVETHSDYYKQDGRIVSLSATCIVRREGKKGRFVFALPLYHPDSVWKRKHRSVMKFLAPTIAKIPKVTAWNGSYDTKWMLEYGCKIGFTNDPMLGVHLLNENVQKGLKPQAQSRLGVEPWGIDTKSLLDKKLKDILHYNVLDTWHMHHLKAQIKQELKDQPRLGRIFLKLMMPAARDLLQSERRGIWVDVQRLKDRLPIAEAKLKEIEEEILIKAGLSDGLSTSGPELVPNWPILKVLKTKGPVYREPNFNASLFARWMLFEHLGLPVFQRGKEKPNGDPGDPSMAEDVLLTLKDYHPVVQLMLDRVQWQKMISSFFKPYLELYDEDHRIHTNFKLAGTVTGRLSSGKSDEDKISAGKGKVRGVNLQQVPRDPFVRGLFGAPPGWTFVESDFSQVELRIAAFLSRDPVMLHLYKIGADIHKATASSVLGIPLSEVTGADRKKAKAVNFGFVYGMGWRKFIYTAFTKYGVTFTEDQAKAVRVAYFEQFPGLQPWHAKQRRLVREYGRVQSPIGRIRHLPDIYSPDEGVQAEAERQAINSPVQSFGSDMAVMSMIHINRKFREQGIIGNCLGLVHDAVNFEIRNDDLARALPIIQDTMEDTSIIRKTFGVHIDVPILADVKVGKHWGDSKELTREQIHHWKPEFLELAA